MKEKISKLKRTLSQNNLDSFLFTNYYSIFYLSSFKGVSETERESFLVYVNGKLHLIAPRLYQYEAKALEAADLKVHIAVERDEMLSIPTDLILKSRCGNAGFESEDLRYSEYELVKGATKKKLVPMLNLASKLREIKTEEEIDIIRRAQEITYKAFKNILPIIKPGITEKEIASKLKGEMESLGAEGDSFSAIVASGAGSALPHYSTSNKKLKKGEAVLLDFGAKYKGYCADTTRMVFLGKPSDKMVKIYDLVKKSHEEGVKAVKEGVLAKDVFAKSYEGFEKERVADKFTHGLGHGVGLAIHETPYIRRTSAEPLKEGMVFSVEPGLYFPGFGGVRIEDLVVCRKGKAEVLGNFTKDIVVI